MPALDPEDDPRPADQEFGEPVCDAPAESRALTDAVREQVSSLPALDWYVSFSDQSVAPQLPFAIELKNRSEAGGPFSFHYRIDPETRRAVDVELRANFGTGNITAYKGPEVDALLDLVSRNAQSEELAAASFGPRGC